LKHINYILIFIFSLIINSCNESNQIQHLSGYWEINSVTLNGKEVKNFPFSNTVDYFILNQNNSGFRKKVKPRIDGGFDINLHQMDFKIDKNKNGIYLIYGEGRNFIESITKIDSINLHLSNNDGYLYKYKRFYPKNYLNE